MAIVPIQGCLWVVASHLWIVPYLVTLAWVVNGTLDLWLDEIPNAAFFDAG